MARSLARLPAHGWALLTLLLSSLGVRLWLALRPIPWLLDRFLMDDAYYYYVVARHIVAGNGSTADGVSPANGYHPLWMLLGLPLFALSGEDRDLPVHLTLCLQALLDVGAGYLIYRLVQRLGASPWTGVLAALLYLCPFGAVVESLNGLETSLATTLLLALTLVWLRLQQSRSLRAWAGFGLLLGLAILARTDIGLLAPLLALALLWRWRADLGAAVRRVAAVTAGALLITAPWFLFSLVKTGHLVQTSGLADPLIYRRQFEAWGYASIPIAQWWDRSLHCLGDAWSFIAWRLASPPLLLLLALGLGLALLLGQGAALRPLGRRLLRLWPILALALAVMLVDSFIRWYPRRWHMAPAALALALAAALGAEALLRAASWRRSTLALLTLTLCLPLGQHHWDSWPKVARFAAPFQRAGALQTLREIEQQFPAGAVLGHSDCGIMSYYARRVTIVNLDGVINAAAYEALRRRDLLGYARERGITALWLRDGMLYPEVVGMSLFAHGDFSAGFVRPLPDTSPAPPLVDDSLAVDRGATLAYFRGGLETSPRGPSEGTFTLGSRAELSFSLAPDTTPAAYIGLELHASAVSRPQEHVTVELNGHTLAELVLRQGAGARVQPVPLPAGLLTRRDNALRLRLKAPRSPRALGRSEDVRRLGALLLGLRFLRPPAVSWLPPSDPALAPQATNLGPARWLNGEPSHWVLGKSAELNANLPARRYRQLSVRLAPVMVTDPPQTVRVLFEGIDLGRQPLGPQVRDYGFPLPASCCGAGRHHLRLEFEQLAPATGAASDPQVAALLSGVALVP